MPRYKFHWSNLPQPLLGELCDGLGVDASTDDPADALRGRYGARPKEDFVHDAWPILLEDWIGHTTESRQWVIDALHVVCGEEGTLTKHRDQMTYLRGLRNAKNLRGVVLEEFIAFGEIPSGPEQPPGEPVAKPVSAGWETEAPKPAPRLSPPPAGDPVSVTVEKPPTWPSEDKKPFTAAPGSVVLVRDAEWLVTGVEQAADGFFVHVIGLSELVRDTVATFSTALDTVVAVDPTKVRVTADDSPGFRRSRLWLEATLRKTPVAIADPALTIAHRGLAAHLDYQFKAVQQALDPDKLRPRILLADAVGLGKTIEIGMILA